MEVTFFIAPYFTGHHGIPLPEPKIYELAISTASLCL